VNKICGWSTGGMILRGKNGRAHSNTCPSVTFSTLSPTTCAGMGLNPGLSQPLDVWWNSLKLSWRMVADGDQRVSTAYVDCTLDK
jgi:hypothetical protein